MYERWMEHASCADLPRDTFFPTDGGGVVTAQRICASCPVVGACLEYALRHRVEHGVWGGCSERKRRRILSERSRELVAMASGSGASSDGHGFSYGEDNPESDLIGGSELSPLTAEQGNDALIG